jgi:beta-glucosidase-like glycosyl hydrolase
LHPNEKRYISEDVAMIEVFKKVSAGTLLSLGFIFLMVTVSELPKKDRDSNTILGGLVLSVPLLVGGGWILLGMSRQNQRLLQAQKQLEIDRLNSIFFRLIEEKNGRVTVLQMAMAAQISGEAARNYLDDRAEEFEATFDVGDRGEIFYLFNSEN